MSCLQPLEAWEGEQKSPMGQTGDGEQMELEMPKQTALPMESEDCIVLWKDRTVRANASSQEGLERI